MWAVEFRFEVKVGSEFGGAGGLDRGRGDDVFFVAGVVRRETF
jgi:hypothetical protein